MKTSIKKLKNCKNVVEIELPPEKVKEEFDKVYKGIKKVANVPGYRVGNVPKDLLEKHYSKTANEEVIKSLISETYEKILEKYKLNPIAYPEVSEVKLDLKEGLSYKASIEVRPEVTFKKHKGLKLKRKKVEVEEEDINKNLESLQQIHAQNSPKKDSEEKEKVIPRIDDEFAKDLSFENLEKLKDVLRQNLLQKLQKEADADLEIQVINQLVDGAVFEVPDSFVNAEKQRLLKDAENRISYIEAIQKKENHDKKFIMTDKDRKELEKNAGAQALRQVKAFFILDKIAEIEKIYIKREEMDAHMEMMARQQKKTKEEVMNYLEKNHMLDEVAVNSRNKKVMEFLLKEAKIES